MSLGSYFKLYRKALRDGMFKGEPFDRFHAWVWLISEARYKPETVQEIDLQRGQLFTRERDLVDIFGWSRGRVRRTLKLFEDAGMISLERTRSGTIITITNYEKYQPRTLDGTTERTYDGTSKPVENTGLGCGARTSDGTTKRTTDGTFYLYKKEITNKSPNNALPREGGAAAEWRRRKEANGDD